MEETQVLIVGAGPSGLALGLALARFQVRSVILEKDSEVTIDPRGVYLTGDAVRILYDLGLENEVSTIGHEVHKINFHRSSFGTKPYYRMNIGTRDVLQQAVPEGILQSQPRLESALREKVRSSKYCTLRTACRVINITHDDLPSAEYIDEQEKRHQIRSEWLVGADGKVGVVRKHFLEPTAGIIQEEGKYPYNGTWIAANLKISIPTPQTHPTYPLWDLGYSPEAVYDLFWPEGWHFCGPPGKATATGRFGPPEERMWRHELCQSDWNDSMDAESLFWEHLKPMITRERDDDRGCDFSSPVQFPVDCIKILRCRPYRFAHKVVNRWFHKRVVLIGDAAHVFPPFAGQGIASGVRDAHQLAWRLALLLRSKSQGEALVNNILGSWALERRKSVDDAAKFTMLNGYLCNNEPSIWLRILLHLAMFLESNQFSFQFLDPQAIVERRGFTHVQGGFFLENSHGGARLTQMYVQSNKGVSILSDSLLQSGDCIFTIVAICNGVDDSRIYQDAKEAVEGSGIDPAVLSASSIVMLSPTYCGECIKPVESVSGEQVQVFSPAMHPGERPGMSPQQNGHAYLDRLGRSTRFALLRPDFFAVSCCKNVKELEKCLSWLKGRLVPQE